MKRIFKYPLEVTDDQILKIPKDAEFLYVKDQFNVPCLWVLVDLNKPPIDYLIKIIGTGNPIDDTKKTYIDSFMLNNGEFVFHVFVEEI